MLRIIVELVPGGYEPAKRELARAKIGNISGLAALNNYVSGRLGTAKFGDLINSGVAVAQSPDSEALLDLMQGFYDRDRAYCFRREMFYAMRAALRIKCARPSCSLADAIWEVQNRIRHAGRLISDKSVGSTLLVKGLEFDHAIIVHSANMTSKDWYVALTRASKTVTVLSPVERFAPAN